MSTVGAIIAANCVVIVFNIIGMTIGANPPSGRVFFTGWAVLMLLFVGASQL